MFYRSTYPFSGQRSGGGEDKLTLERFIDVCGDWKLVEIAIVNYLTPGDVGDWLPYMI